MSYKDGYDFARYDFNIEALRDVFEIEAYDPVAETAALLSGYGHPEFADDELAIAAIADVAHCIDWKKLDALQTSGVAEVENG